MISQTVEYALRAMAFLAGLNKAEAVSNDVISKRTLVPRDYLSKVMRDLTLAGLVSSRRGPGGGFALARAASEISILDVINAVDPFQRIDHCPMGNPAHVKLCPLHRRIDDALATIQDQFARTSLDEVLSSNQPAANHCARLTDPTVRGSRPRRKPA